MHLWKRYGPLVAQAAVVRATVMATAAAAFWFFCGQALFGPPLCGPQFCAQAAETGAGSKGTLVIDLPSNPNSLFPLTETDGESAPVVTHLFESLLDRHWETYDWLPQVAKKCDQSTDGKTISCELDPRAKFTDGTSVTPEDVKFSFDFIFMKGVESAPQKPYYENIEKCEVVGKTGVKFTTRNVYYKNFDVIAGLTIFQKKHYLALYEKDHSMAKAQSVRTPMGTSQWMFDRFNENQQLILKRNENYWDKETLQKQGRWTYDRIIFKIIPEQSVAFEALRKGDITYKGLTPKQWQLQSDTPDFKAKLVKVKTINKMPVSYQYIGWNQTNPLFAKKELRWALAHLVNQNLWIRKFDFGLMEPAISPYGPKSDEHDPAIKAVPYSLEEARKKLKEAGWVTAGPDGFLVKDGQKLEVTIIYPTQSKEVIEPKLTEYKNTAAKVGVSILLKSVEWTTFTKLLDERKFDGVCLAWTRSIDSDLKQIFHSSSVANKGSNFIGYKNPELDKLIDLQRQTLSRPERIKLARKIEKIITDDQPYAFLGERKHTLYAHQKSVVKPVDTFPYSLGTDFWKISTP